ncbi:Type II/IV secretion system protein TadC,associated with Flp pilus assembly [Candidatus Paraburkholderia kirkii UZHbot1]|uniref:Type II/IV secretion system protein TadC,associated with Flp pilus assembly n=1 Tax=Candidatus Paraburkholderia kirkii UZHbot1 TaxID=1055526 RepID=G4M7Q8_9BURK|nr:Type II/IV secretion system protein TadC,associated with Flp pilus assembly [Candidatus Paraburkholderia kirkii UZHbot1]
MLLGSLFATVFGSVAGLICWLAPRDIHRRIEQAGAGWRTLASASLYFTAKTVLAVVLPLLGIGAAWLSHTTLVDNRALLWILLCVLDSIGYYAPNVVLSHCRAVRQREIFEGFPDAIDLLTVCIKAGLSMDAALMRVIEEIAISSPAVASELELMLLELRSVFTKDKALRNLALRTGVEDVNAFVSMLIQADRFDTSIGASLRVMSDTLRTRRRMLAEERAAKVALKLMFPLIFCIFPALLTVLFGPAFIHIFRVLMPTMTGSGG